MEVYGWIFLKKEKIKKEEKERENNVCVISGVYAILNKREIFFFQSVKIRNFYDNQGMQPGFFGFFNILAGIQNIGIKLLFLN